MTRTQYGVWSGVGLALVAFAWLVFVAVPRWSTPQTAETQATDTRGNTIDPGRRINATLFYVAEDGLRLEQVVREVAYQPDTTEQARTLVEEQLKPAPAPLASPIPAGTALHTLFITQRGEAFVDLSREVVANHPGGSLDELFTVYAIVNTLTANLPAVSGVQILVDGKEVDTIAGHVDMRHPLGQRHDEAGATAPPRVDVDQR